ncbi:MAG: hypothetical protein WCD79_15135 [Chthoniobacteraceae bacterium]
MKTKCFLIFITFVLFWRPGYSESPITRQNYLSLIPDLAKATLNEGYGKIPFIVKNNSDEDVVFIEQWRLTVSLLTVNDAGHEVPIEDFKNPFGPHWHSGGGPVQIVLKPGESKTYDSPFSMDTFAFVAGKNKKIFGKISGHTAHTNRAFVSRSEPFAIPPELARPPWTDLGKQDYFSVTIDPTKPEVIKGYLFIILPITITNTTAQTYIAASERVSFYVVHAGSKNQLPDLWETIKATKPVLKPGDSTHAGGRSYFRMEELVEQGYHPGDKIIVVVGGKIPDTNKVFECYSAPFDLTPLPEPH